MTNFSKLVRWDADYYNSLPGDDECIICLTEREVYLLSEAIHAIRWVRTRWIGNILGMDFDKIASDLEYKLEERLTCQTLTQTIQDLQIQVTNLQNTIENNIDPAPDYDPNETTITQQYPDGKESAEYVENFTVSTDGCDTEDKDALWSATREIVNYIHAVNMDALQNISQLGNISDQIDRLIAATPLGLLPLDEAFGYATFILEELLEEYEATVDEELLQEVTCDLFCRFVANGCSIDMVDVANYMAQQIGSGFDAYVNTFADVLQFATTGTVSGDEIFYAFSLIQLVAATLAEHFFNVKSAQQYIIRAMTGLNSPDNDWTLLCVDCPPLFRHWTWDFANGMGDWQFEVTTAAAACGAGIVMGELDGNSLKGVHCSSQNLISAKHPFDPTWRVVSARMVTRRENGISNGTYDYSNASLRPTAGSDVGSIGMFFGGFRPNGEDIRCAVETSAPFYWDTGNELVIRAGVSYDNDPVSAIYIDKIELLFQIDYSNPEGTITELSTLC